MQILGPNSIGSCAKFYSTDFNVSLQFKEHSGLSGHLSLFPKSLNLRLGINGIHIAEASRHKISFILEYENVNLTHKSLTAFSGEIFEYDRNRYFMLLKWLMINESPLPLASYHGCDFEILLDEPDPADMAKIKRISSLIPSDIFS